MQYIRIGLAAMAHADHAQLPEAINSFGRSASSIIKGLDLSGAWTLASAPYGASRTTEAKYGLQRNARTDAFPRNGSALMYLRLVFLLADGDANAFRMRDAGTAQLCDGRSGRPALHRDH